MHKKLPWELEDLRLVLLLYYIQEFVRQPETLLRTLPILQLTQHNKLSDKQEIQLQELAKNKFDNLEKRLLPHSWMRLLQLSLLKNLFGHLQKECLEHF